MFGEDTSNAAKIGFVLCIVLLLCVTFVYSDEKKLKKNIHNHRNGQAHHKHPRWYFNKKQNMSLNSNFKPSENYDIDTLYQMIPQETDKADQFLKNCEENCYYHPECIAVEATREMVPSPSADGKDKMVEVVSSCNLKAHSGIKETNNKDTYFIRRVQNPNSRERLEFESRINKYLPPLPTEPIIQAQSIPEATGTPAPTQSSS